MRDFAQVKAHGVISADIACQAADLLGIDRQGLDEMDKMILSAIVEKFNGGPVGLNTLAIAVGEESETLEEVYERF